MNRVPFAMIVFLMLTGLLIPSIGSSHPLKLSASLIEYDPKGKTIRMECKVFVDDFLQSLSRTVLKGIEPMSVPKDKMPHYVEAYFRKFYRISLNGKAILLKYEDITHLEQQNVLVIEFAKVPVLIKEGDKIQIENTIFFGDFGELQSNRVYIRIEPFSITDAHVATSDDYTISYTLGAVKR